MPSQRPPHDTLLAFDTSTECMAVGVWTGGQRWSANLPGGAAASAALLPALQGLLQQAGRVMTDVAAIAFGKGPGAFTGLRASCAVAQGLAVGLGRPVLAIDSLLIVAEQARLQAGADEGFEVGVAMDARMGEAYAARYRWQGAAWQVLQAPGLWSPEALREAWTGKPPAHLCGSAVDAFANLAALATADRRIAEGDDRAGALLGLAAAAWARGAGVDAAEALPLYLRDKVAQTTDERAALRAAAAALPSP